MTPEKQLLLDEIKEEIDRSSGMIVTGFKSMTPQNSWDFMEKLSNAKGKYKVVKKRVFEKAAEASGMKFDLSSFKDHVGIVFVQGDSVTAAKAVYTFADETKVPLK
ncbi:MAG TPA: 50S ribosomal protein L10, partial [Chlamydiales bacterium]|nr:50S ribosomal protein L10 [Chlamydiales bacterium]